MVLCDASGEVVTKAAGPCADEDGGGDLLGIGAFQKQEKEGGEADANRPESIDG